MNLFFSLFVFFDFHVSFVCDAFNNAKNHQIMASLRRQNLAKKIPFKRSALLHHRMFKDRCHHKFSLIEIGKQANAKKRNKLRKMHAQATEVNERI